MGARCVTTCGGPLHLVFVFLHYLRTTKPSNSGSSAPQMWILTRRMAQEGDQKLSFTIPLLEPLPSQYYIRAVSDDWIGAETVHTISFQNLILPQRMPPHTGAPHARPPCHRTVGREEG
jgi:hypothetical protein